MMRKKIALLITGLGMGGAERQVCALADEFSKLGFQVLLISLTNRIVVSPQSKEVVVVSVNMRKSLSGFFLAYFKVRRLICEFKPDVVHSHMIHANLFSRLLRLSVRIPRLICSAHSTNEGGWARMLAYRITDSLCDISTNVSNEAVAAFIKQKAVTVGRMVPMFNGVDSELFSFDSTQRQQRRTELGFNNSTIMLLAVGRLTAAKDYLNLLSGFVQLSEKFNCVQLVIIGSGEDHDILTKYVVDNSISQKVHFLGLRRDVHEWMSAADIFVLSSSWEGMPLVILAAMCAQRFIISTDCGGIKNLVGEYLKLVPIRSSHELARAIEYGCTLSDSERSQLGLKARDFVSDNYSLTVVSKKWLQLYFH